MISGLLMRVVLSLLNNLSVGVSSEPLIVSLMPSNKGIFTVGVIVAEETGMEARAPAAEFGAAKL